jgi:hypothetical protein
MNQELQVLSLFDLDKKQRQEYVQQTIERINNGELNPLKAHLQVKAMEDIIKGLTSDDAYRNMLLDEAAKYGKSFEFMNGKFSTKETGVRYSYDQCEDPILSELYDNDNELQEKIKARQKFLQSVPPEGLDIRVGDELVTIYPPSKSSTTSVTVTLN